jgi:hypothetical protein
MGYILDYTVSAYVCACVCVKSMPTARQKQPSTKNDPVHRADPTRAKALSPPAHLIGSVSPIAPPPRTEFLRCCRVPMCVVACRLVRSAVRRMVAVAVSVKEVARSASITVHGALMPILVHLESISSQSVVHITCVQQVAETHRAQLRIIRAG